jgi:hypothetical protein
MGFGFRVLIGSMLQFLLLSSVARAEGARAPAVWYRASDQCPSGADFLEKVTGSATVPRLAEAGDHIDFLVTLVATGAETVGRLERQTRAGTVAIRELRDANCDRVAEALALSLGLALEPGREPTEPPVAAESASVTGAVAANNPPALALAVIPKTFGKAAAPPSAPTHNSAPRTGRRWSGALDLGVLYGLAPRPMARGSLLVDADHAWPALSSTLSLRFGLVGAFGSAETRIGSVTHWVLGGSAAACPWRWELGRLGLRPCLGVELGVVGASHDSTTGFGERTLWATPGVELRANVALTSRLDLEAGAGVQLPILRNEIFAGPSSLYRAQIALFQGTLGISFGLP